MSQPFSQRKQQLFAVIFAFSIALLTIYSLYFQALSRVVNRWQQEEYSHGYLIPVVALLLLWQRLPALLITATKPSWLGLLVAIGALSGWALGELSALYIIIQYSFIVLLLGLFLSLLGINGIRIIWASLAYLLFMIPLPSFLYNNLSQTLQLISSEWGVFVIRLFGIAVYLEGNVIDLGTYQLQVIEACSGLRYLFPLMSIGFLIAYLYKGPLWQKLIIFFSTLPITLIMNSLRIGMIGLAVEFWGIAAAEGVLHDFEGWVIFLLCLITLLAEIWLMNRFTMRNVTLAEKINLTLPTPADIRSALSKRPQHRTNITPLIGTTIAMALSIPIGYLINERVELVPERQQLSSFPLIKDQWIGRENPITDDVISALKLSDYIKVDYQHDNENILVNLYIAYYDSQRKGSSIHSPRSCLPGGGWEIESLSTQQLTNIWMANVRNPQVNRVLIKQGGNYLLVYYWFQQRGRIIKNEYEAKWFIFQDSLLQHRTDGALVRITTTVDEGSSIDMADRRLQQFIADFSPTINQYIPDQNAI